MACQVQNIATYRQAYEHYSDPEIPLMLIKIVILLVFYYFIIISFLLSEIKSYRSAMLILKISQSAVPKRLRNTGLMNYFLPDNALAILNQNWEFWTESSKYFGKGVIYIVIEKIYSNLVKSRAHAHEFTRYALSNVSNSTPPWMGGVLDKNSSWVDRFRGDKLIHTSPLNYVHPFTR
jgi:hypothetical protein